MWGKRAAALLPEDSSAGFMIIDTLLGELAELQSSGTDDNLAAKVDETIEEIRSGTATSGDQRRRLLTMVRGRRAFGPLARLCEALTWAGHDRPLSPDGKGGSTRNPGYDPRVRQEMIQAMIDQGQLIPALDVVDQHRRRIESLGTGERPPADAGLAYAWGQACGLAGRIHKQIYVDNAGRDARGAFADHLRHAISWYGLPFRRYGDGKIRCDEVRDDEWHAINLVALLSRAEKDGIAVPGESAKARASELVAAIRGKIERAEKAGKAADAWTWASLGEAHVALGAWDSAVKAYEQYAGHAAVDRFQLYGSLRQLIEVWQIDGSQGEGKSQAVINALGARFGAQGPDGDIGQSLFAVEEHYDEQNRLVTHVVLRSPNSQRSEVLQSSSPAALRSLGQAFKTAYAMPLVRAARTAHSVGRVIDFDSENTVGTGFVIDGGHVLPELARIPVFVTNWHVLSETNPRSAVGRRNARIRFDLANDEQHRVLELQVETFLWESPQSRHDACLVLLSPTPAWLTPLKVASPDTLPDSLDAVPVRDRCCCVVGFAGKDKSRFVGDGHSLKLLDLGRHNGTAPHEPLIVHYSNQTQPGDSGGPVCNPSWEVVALHHAGAVPTKRLHPVTRGRHNGDVAEGVAIKSIIAAMALDAEKIRARLADNASAVQEVQGMTPGDAFRALVSLDGAAGDIAQSDIDTLVSAATVFASEDDGLIDEAATEAPPMGPVVSSADVAQRDAIGGLKDSLVVLLSRINRSARNTHFQQMVEQREPGRRILTDGDSWFQYPRPGVEDVVDQLVSRFGYIVNCGAIAGETLEGRLAESDVDQRAGEIEADAVVLSGGGNDMLGYGAIVGYLRPFKEGMKVEDLINMTAIDKKVSLLVEHHATWIGRIRNFNDRIPIFNHGYDYAVPKRKGPWLDRPLSRHGVRDAEMQRQIVRVIIDRFGEGMAALAASEKNVHFVNCRGRVRTGAYWMDELHPTNDGFARVAACFFTAIEDVLRKPKA